jgi:hypothetical protein
MLKLFLRVNYLNYLNSEFSISITSKMGMWKEKVIFHCVFNDYIVVFILLSLSSDILFTFREKCGKKEGESMSIRRRHKANNQIINFLVPYAINSLPVVIPVRRHFFRVQSGTNLAQPHTSQYHQYSPGPFHCQ